MKTKNPRWIVNKYFIKVILDENEHKKAPISHFASFNFSSRIFLFKICFPNNLRVDEN